MLSLNADSPSIVRVAQYKESKDFLEMIKHVMVIHADDHALLESMCWRQISLQICRHNARCLAEGLLNVKNIR